MLICTLFKRGFHDLKKGNFDQNWLDPKNKTLKKICIESEKVWHDMQNFINFSSFFSFQLLELM